MEDKVEGASKQIPESFVDLIGRFVPGCVLLLVYLWPAILRETSAVLGLGFIVLAYFVGLFTEVLSRMWLSPLLRRAFSLLSTGFYPQAREMLRDFEQFRYSQQFLLKKMMAESALFRTSATACIALLLWPPMHFASIKHYYPTVAAAMIAFLLCHVHCQRHLRHRVEVFRSTISEKADQRGGFEE